VRTLFMENLPADVALFNEYHALIVEHCKVHCRKKPRCQTAERTRARAIRRCGELLRAIKAAEGAAHRTLGGGPRGFSQ